jgi:uncharacterized membrane protein YjgN (DUF898 family)
MATVYITEYAGVGRSQVGGSYMSVAVTPAVANQTVAIGANTQSSAFSTTTTLIRVHADSVCSIAIGGTNPAATTAIARFAAGQTEYFGVTPGDKLAVISNT